MIAELARRSAARARRSTPTKVREDLAERAKDDGVLKIATLIQRREDEKRESEAQKSADVNGVKTGAGANGQKQASNSSRERGRGKRWADGRDRTFESRVGHHR